MKIKFKNGIHEVSVYDIIIIQNDSKISETTITAVSCNGVAIKVNSHPDWKILNDYFADSSFIDIAPPQQHCFSKLIEQNKSKPINPDIISFTFDTSSIGDITAWTNPYDSPYNKTHPEKY